MEGVDLALSGGGFGSPNDGWLDYWPALAASLNEFSQPGKTPFRAAERGFAFWMRIRPEKQLATNNPADETAG